MTDRIILAVCAPLSISLFFKRRLTSSLNCSLKKTSAATGAARRERVAIAENFIVVDFVPDGRNYVSGIFFSKSEPKSQCSLAVCGRWKAVENGYGAPRSSYGGDW